MLLGVETVLIVIGLYALVMGKFAGVHGWPARILGLLGLLPIPLSLAVGFGIGMLKRLLGREHHRPMPFWLALSLEACIVIGCVIVMVVLHRAYRDPVRSRSAADQERATPQARRDGPPHEGLQIDRRPG